MQISDSVIHPRIREVIEAKNAESIGDPVVAVEDLTAYAEEIAFALGVFCDDQKELTEALNELNRLTGKTFLAREVMEKVVSVPEAPVYVLGAAKENDVYVVDGKHFNTLVMGTRGKGKSFQSHIIAKNSSDQ
jgi:hypothetical protein